jgi:hypothetical protein
MRGFVGGLLASSLVLVSACGGGSPSTSPTGPSSVAAPPAGGTTGGATVAGTVVASSSPNGLRALSTGLTVQVVGTGIAVTAGPDGSFSLNGVPAGEVRLRFSGDGHDATLTITGVENGQRVEIRVVVSGATATLDSDSRRDPAKPEQQIEGRIEAVPSADTIVVAGQTVRLDAATVIQQDGRTMSASDLLVGLRVRVKALLVGGVLTATRIEIQNTNITARGVVSGLSGSCPTLTFSVGSVVVETSATTRFTPACGSVVNGATVEVEGVRDQASGRLLAESVEIEEEEMEARGVVSGLSGTCPTLTFSVGSVVVETSAATRFSPACSSVVAGATVEVEGVRNPTWGRLVARSVRVEEEEMETPLNLNGLVERLTGTATDFRFSVNGTEVRGDDDTEFFGTGNRQVGFENLRNGIRVEVKAERRDGYAYAARIHVNESEGDQGQGQAVELRGTVGSLVGTCPNLTFAVAGTTVDTSPTTIFTANCAAVVAGATVQVKGLKQPSGRVLAAEVKVEDASAPPPAPPLVFEGTGTIGGLAGSCPLIRFTLGTTSVAATVGTDFRPACASLRNGDRVEVRGTRTTADGPVTATSIRRQ